MRSTCGSGEPKTRIRPSRNLRSAFSLSTRVSISVRREGVTVRAGTTRPSASHRSTVPSDKAAAKAGQRVRREANCTGGIQRPDTLDPLAHRAMAASLGPASTRAISPGTRGSPCATSSTHQATTSAAAGCQAVAGRVEHAEASIAIRTRTISRMRSRPQPGERRGHDGRNGGRTPAQAHDLRPN